MLPTPTAARIAGALVLTGLILRGTDVRAQEPMTPKVGLTARCYYPGTIVLRWSVTPDSGPGTVQRKAPGATWQELAQIKPGTDTYYDCALEADAVFCYRVALDNDRELGPVACANAAEMLVEGDFEAVPIGKLEATITFHRAYGEPWWEITAGRRPGGAGARLLRIRHGEPPRRDGVHSCLFAVDPTSTYRQTGWARSPGRSGRRIGRQLLTADMQPAGGRIVAYGYAPVTFEKADSWDYYEQRLTNLPKDTAFLQVWALAFNARADVTFDDLSIIDERTERFMAFNPERKLARLGELVRESTDPALKQEANRIASTVGTLQKTLATPNGMPLADYLKGMRELNTAILRITDLIWDLRILGLAK